MEIFLIKLGQFRAKLLSRAAGASPRLTIMLRLVGFRLNAYMPKLPREIVRETLQDIPPAMVHGIRLKKSALGELIEAQEPPSLDFRGNIRPIRISRLRRNSMPPAERVRLISSIWPGDKYGFESEVDYLSDYQKAHYAFSPKKGGWDAMRHLEIMSGGCIPIIPGIGLTPDMSLFGYPKSFLSGVWNLVERASLPVPTQGQRDWLQSWGDRYLSSEAQARFLLSESQFNIGSQELVLLVDLSLASGPDYVSMGTLVGLHRALRSDQLLTLSVPEYLLNKNAGFYKSLYGRGFAYSGELADSGLQPRHFPSLEVLLEKAMLVISQNSVSLLVVSGIDYLDNNPELRLKYLTALTSLVPKTALIHGGDFILSSFEQERLSQLGMLFIREF